MKIKFYYHVFLTEDFGSWSSIVLEQFKMMEDSFLTDHIDDVYIGCVYTLETSRQSFDLLAKKYFPNATIEYHKNTIVSDEDTKFFDELNGDKATTENVTLQRIHKDSQNEDFLALYLHSKGVTATNKTLRTLDIDNFLKYHYWRQYLNWGVIENWKKCVEYLDKGYDIASLNFMFIPYPHVSGNVWWSKSSYIRILPKPDDITWYDKMKSNSGHWGFRKATLRMRDEYWITCEANYKIALIHLNKREDNPSIKYLPRREYAKSV